jgi:hypothetical protein
VLYCVDCRAFHAASCGIFCFLNRMYLVVEKWNFGITFTWLRWIRYQSLSTFECTIRENEQFFWEGPRLLAHPLSQSKIVFYHQVFIRISNKICRTSKANAKRENMRLLYPWPNKSVIFAYNRISKFAYRKTDLRILKTTFL